jgi:cell division protein FtsQ
MARKRKSSNIRKPFWERNLERFISITKKLLIPALAIWLIGWLYLGGVFASTQKMAWDTFVSWTVDQGLVVQDVMIEGRNRTDLKKLQSAIAINPNDPLLGLNLNRVQTRIEELNWVDTAIVSRAYNGIVTIRLIEKIPFVIWDRPGMGKILIDTKGTVIEGVNPSDFAKLLTVRGVDAPNYSVDLMQMILAEPDVAGFVQGAEWIGGRRWDLITVMGTRVHLPEDDVGYAIARLAKSQADKKILERDLLSIDLRGTDRIIIETQRGKTQNLMNLSSNTKTNNI